MMVDFGKPIKSLDGRDLMLTHRGKRIVATLGLIVAGVLCGPVEAGVDEKLRRARLAKAAYSNGEVPISADDIEYIRTELGKTIKFPLVLAQCFEMLPGA